MINISRVVIYTYSQAVFSDENAGCKINTCHSLLSMCFLWGRAIRKNALIIGVSEIEGEKV
jgi:hypothetical protein